MYEQVINYYQQQEGHCWTGMLDKFKNKHKLLLVLEDDVK